MSSMLRNSLKSHCRALPMCCHGEDLFYFLVIFFYFLSPHLYIFFMHF